MIVRAISSYFSPFFNCFLCFKKYIFINYYQNGKTFFVYEKGSGIIANDSFLD